jgi:hypothetical protein
MRRKKKLIGHRSHTVAFLYHTSPYSNAIKDYCLQWSEQVAPASNVWRFSLHYDACVVSANQLSPVCTQFRP